MSRKNLNAEQKMNIGAIDIGTNSLRSMIIKIKNYDGFDCKFDVVYRSLKTTRIGKDLRKNGYILDEKIIENIAELKKLDKIFSDYGVEQKIIFATEGVRIARNAGDFLTAAKNEGLDVEIITGEEEAKWTFIGALKAIDKKNLFGGFGVIDIGGGSTELAFGRIQEKKIFYDGGISFPSGCVVLTEEFNTGIFPVPKDNIIALDKKLEKTITALPVKYIGDTLIGVGGTITCLSAIYQKLEKYDSEKVHNSKLHISQILEVYDYLENLEISKREELPGLNDKRGDIIIAGIRILLVVMKHYNFDSIIISDYGIILGILLDRCLKK
ncbi:MAG TPA: hypothetical protein PLM75_04650 [bacterium]|nr:hypothetical protein [bacterium]